MTESPPPPPDSPPPPRAFAQGTGWLLQTLGILLFAANCCVCGMTGLWDPVASRSDIIHQIDSGRPLGMTVQRLFEDPAKAGYMLTVVIGTVGGLAMAVLGLGLQADRRRAAAGAMACVGAVAAIVTAAGVLLWVGHAPWEARAWNAVLVAVLFVTGGFTWHAMREVTANPPPANIDIVPPGTRIPYSFYHDDPPEVRLAKELENRRAKLDVERAEIEKMEKELKERTGEDRSS
jgi:hypothetical protein